MKNIIPRVGAIHDLSGFGRCALTVIIPVISTMGIQVCPIPTALLSTHTGGFEGFHFVDLTDNMKAYATHWKDINLSLDCIYTGYLGSLHQVDIVLEIIDMLKLPDQLVVVDPVMGDDGVLYSTFTSQMQVKMRELVKVSDIITPNLTEAMLLLNEEYNNKPLSANNVKALLKNLSDLGPDKVVITSVVIEDGRHCNAGFIKSTDTYFIVPYETIPASYPGTGDIFASVLTGSVVNDVSFIDAVIKASAFVAHAASETYKYNTVIREGVLLEKVLPDINSCVDFTNFVVI